MMSTIKNYSDPFYTEIGQYRDGVYEGEHSFVKVQVAVDQGKVNDIEILRHGGGGKKYADMVRPLCDEMVSKQTFDVDAVTGATVSSKNLKEAVQSAVQKAR